VKIAFLHHSFIIGSGIDSLIYEYARRLSEENEVEIFTFRSYYKLPTSDWKINVIDIPFGKTRFGSGVFAPLFIPWHKLRNKLEQFDVVVAQLYPANLIPVLPRKLETKVVVVEWGTPEGVWFRWQESLYARLSKQASKIACRRADKVLVSSKFLKEYVTKNFGVISNLVLIDGINFDLLDKDKVVGKKQNDILYVGRVSPHKNIHTLIKAFRLVKDEIPDATLTLVGAQTFPEYSDYLKKLAGELLLGDSVKWEGVVPWEDLPGYYADCAVYCSPSLWEGYMRCEAFAFEKPAVVFDATANAETVHDGIDGIVVKQINPSALAEALVTLLRDDDKRGAMGRAGYAWAKENLDFGVITNKLLEELESDA